MQVIELPPVACLPNFFVQRYLHQPQRMHVGGTMLVSSLILMVMVMLMLMVMLK